MLVSRARAHAGDAALAVGALTILAAAIRFYRIGHQAYWYDEGNTVQLVHLSLGKMLGLLPQTESTPPVYYVAAWAWTRIFGFGEAGLRSLSAVAGVLTVPILYAATRRLLSVRAGIIAAALAACNPLLIWYSQEARSYSLLVLFAAVGLLGFAQIRTEVSARGAATWAIGSVLALGTHYYAIVAIIPQALWLLYAHRRRRAVLVAMAGVVLIGLALIPLAISQNSTGRDTWIANSPLGLRLRQLVPQLLIGTGAPAREVLKFVAMAVVLVALVLLARLAQPRERRPALLAGGLALGGFVLSLIFVIAGNDTLITRNLIALWLPLAMLVAGSLAVARARFLGAALTAALCAIGLIAAVGISAEWKLQRPDWRLAANVLGARSPTGMPRVILVQHFQTLLPLSLYLPHLHSLNPRRRLRVRELDVIAIRPTAHGELCWWGSACNLVPSKLQSRYRVGRGFRAVSQETVRQFVILRLVAPRPVHLTPRMVSRALKTTTLGNDELLLQG